MSSTRRTFLAGLGITAAAASIPASAVRAFASAASCPFRLAVINDEISSDFGHACEVASKDFGLDWIELRSMWKTNIVDLDKAQVAESQKILKKYNLRVTDIASPLFKVDWPGAPLANGRRRDRSFNAKHTFQQQEEVLERCIEMADAFQTNRIRCFDFWRLEDQKPYRAAINDKLRQAAERCAKSNKILLLENEMSCNTATGVEAAPVLHAIPNKNFMLNWDPGNAAAFGTTPYPNGYDLLPKHRIGHCHCKDVVRKPGVKYEWAPVGGGVVDWVGQFRAFKRDGYHYAVSLETHWRGGGTPEASSRTSMKGLKECLKKAGITC
ncbi:MAG: sugar phosphate isomerase/epimerase family protein [Acidobacteriaceae bacterium]